jgi:Outer membrane protein beta-barrel domain
MRKLILLLLITVPMLAQSRWEVYAGLSHARQKSNSGDFIVSEGGDTFQFAPCAADSADILGGHLQRVFCNTRDFHGFNAGATYRLTPALGWRTDFSAYFDKARAVDTFGEGADAHTDTNTFTDRTYILVTGLEASRELGSWRPFAHVMGGVARQTSNDVQTSTGPFDFELRDRVTSFAMKAGGGIDVRLTPRLDLRAIEVDYAPVFGRARHIPGNADFDERVKGKTAQNITFGIGLVWR